MDIAAYLARIGYDGRVEPIQPALAALVRAHVLSVPFENLDVQFGRTLTTDPGAAFEKIVNGRRGGWCYEQNGLFGWALADIGFHVTRIAAAVMRGVRGEGSMGNHLALLVRCDDSDTTWLVDVGFGGALLAPVPLAVGEYVHAPFRLGLRRTPDDYWQFYEDAGDGEFSFDFQALPADEAVLATRCQFQNSDPSSVFVQNFVAQRRLPETHRTLRGRVLSEAGPGGMSTRHIDTADEFVATLRDDFSLDVPESAALWPRIVERHEAFLREKAG